MPAIQLNEYEKIRLRLKIMWEGGLDGFETILSDYNNKTNEYTYNLGHGYDDTKICMNRFL